MVAGEVGLGGGAEGPPEGGGEGPGVGAADPPGPHGRGLAGARQLEGGAQPGPGVPLEDPIVSGALTWGTVLSIPYAIGELVPLVAEAYA